MLPSSVFESIFNASPVGEYLLTPEATILAVNDAFLKVSSRKREDLVGRNLFDVFPSNPDDPNDTGLLALQRSLARVIETGKADTLALQRYPIWIELPDGSRKYEERFWSATNTPIFNDEGQLQYIAHSTMDVTDMAIRESKAEGRPDSTEMARLEAGLFTRAHMVQEINRALEAERSRLMDSVTRWQLLFDQAPGFACLLSGPNHEFVFANPEYLKLVGNADIVGKPAREALPWIAEQGFLEILDEVYRSGKPYKGQAAIIAIPKPEGAKETLRYLNFVYQPIRNESGVIHGIFVLGSDVSEQKQAEEALREADQRKDVFLATLAHELRNPLAPIKTGIAVLRLGKNDHEIVDCSLEMMERQVNHLVGLVDDLLDISRISQGKVTLKFEELDLRDAVGKALEASATLIHAGGREVFVDLPPDPLMVSGDPMRLVQVIANILNNAARYTDEHGIITVTLSRDAQLARLSIRDNGIGIEPQLQRNLFQMFMQVDPERGGGLGIGLTLVQNLVGLHGGTVEVHSEGLGHGSEFTVTLPLILGDGPERSRETHDGRMRLNGKQVLVVDDNRDAATSLGMLLQLLGADVITANDGPSALAILDEFHPDVIFLDLGMPTMDGFEVARRLRARPFGKDPTLVAITGWGQEEDRRRTTKAGFDHHLVKPVGMKELQEVMRVRR